MTAVGVGTGGVSSKVVVVEENSERHKQMEMTDDDKKHQILQMAAGGGDDFYFSPTATIPISPISDVGGFTGFIFRGNNNKHHAEPHTNQQPQ